MGRDWKKSTAKGKDAKNADKAFVPKFKFYGKAALVACPDEDGCPFYLNKADDEREFFSDGFIVNSRAPDNEELFQRIGMAVCLGAASFHESHRR